MPLIWDGAALNNLGELAVTAVKQKQDENKKVGIYILVGLLAVTGLFLLWKRRG